MEKQQISKTMIRERLGGKARIDSAFYQAKLDEAAERMGIEEATGLDRSLLMTVNRLHFVGAVDFKETPEDEQFQLFAKYSATLTNLMEEAKHIKAPVPVRAPAQICVAAIVTAHLIRERKADINLQLTLVEHLLEQMEYAAAYFLKAEEARECESVTGMIDLIAANLKKCPQSTPLTAAASMVVAFGGLLHGLIGVGSLEDALTLVEEQGADALWYYLDQGYRFFGLPPVVCGVLETTLGVCL